MRKAFKRNNLLTQESFRKFVMLIENGIGDFTNKINVDILPKSKEGIIKEY
ncbi:diguanylate cyclase [Lachnoanaerobaculum saburreum]|nr:diguanylate cyclase [Lachnoanaerobaculum saburreum]